MGLLAGKGSPTAGELGSLLCSRICLSVCPEAVSQWELLSLPHQDGEVLVQQHCCQTKESHSEGLGKRFMRGGSAAAPAPEAAGGCRIPQLLFIDPCVRAGRVRARPWGAGRRGPAAAKGTGAPHPTPLDTATSWRGGTGPVSPAGAWCCFGAQESPSALLCRLLCLLIPDQDTAPWAPSG